VLVVSPHLDDAVFACGDLIAAHRGARVVTLFTAGPAEGDDALRPWDRDCGFSTTAEVMPARRAEDLAALAVLGATPLWLPFRDDQYGHDADASAIAEALTRVVDAASPAALFVPLGLFHRDHLLAHEAAMHVQRRRPSLTWLAYEDAIYRGFPRDPVGARVAALGGAGFELERADLGRGPASAVKRAAVACYRSQLCGLQTSGRAGHADAFEPERFWRVRPRASTDRSRDGRPRRLAADAAGSSAPS
jgi:LmbE family N-acetylglucosaminyl deacetylase